MGYGALIRNTENDIQIDGDIENFYKELESTVTLTGAGSLIESALSTSLTTNSSTHRIHTVKLDQTDYFCLYGGKKYSQTEWGKFYVESGKTITITYAMWMYGTRVKEPTAGDYGIHVYDETGTFRVFSSGDRFMRYVDTYTASCPIRSTGGIPGSTVDVTVENAYDNFFYLSPIGTSTDVIYRADGQWVSYVYKTMMKAHNQTTVRISNRLVSSSSGSTGVSASSRRTLGMANVNLVEIADKPA